MATGPGSVVQIGIPQPHPKNRKIAIVGSRSVGKSSLACRFVEGVFVDSYYPTIENTFTKDIVVKGQHYMTEIIDTAGQDEYSILNSKHYIGIHGYMLVYSVASKSSFEMISVIRDKILEHTGLDELPMIIVGNKCDLRPEQRQVTPSEAKKKAAEWKNCVSIEASARYDENVAQAFHNLIVQVEKGENPDQPPEKSNCEVM